MNTNKSEIEIPITVKKYEGYTVNYHPNPLGPNTFPVANPNEDRFIRIGYFEICDYDHSARFIKKYQRIKIEPPFCFDKQLGETEIELNPNSFNALQDYEIEDNTKIIFVYLCVDSIDELKGKLNLEEDFKFTFKWEENSTTPNLNVKNEAEEQTIKPYIARAIPKISFRPFENCLEVEGTNSYNVIYSPEDTDGYRFCLGNIVVRNLQKVPYRDENGNPEQVSLPNLRAYLAYMSEDGNYFHAGYISANGAFVTEADVFIPNGADDISFNLYLDWEKWREGANPTSLYLRVISKDKKVLYECNFLMTPQYYNDVYSLDLGTTGIVVAKEKSGEYEIVILDDDKDNPIESDQQIISSLTMLIAKEGDDKSEILLSPSANDYYGITKGNRFRLVPSKFIIGQERIPYLQEFYNSNKFNKKTELFGLEDSEVELVDTNGEETNQKIIGALYKSVFKRFSKETNQIKKLVITYPNTYTIEHLDSIKSVLQNELKLNLDGQVTFVPESDAVAAYYFDQKIMDGGFLDKRGAPQKEVNVVIYDMGAGTLDLSLISFKQSEDESITASIVNKIGIPLAGNYLNYIVYNTLIDKGVVKEENFEGKDNTIKEMVEAIKYEYTPSNKSIKESHPDWYKENQDYLELSDNDSYLSLFGESLEKFLECCGKTVLKILIPKGNAVDIIVFSGRASKFSVLRDKVKDSLESLIPGSKVKVEELVPVGNCGDTLKTCVAIGALKYQNFFNDNDLFRIENKNLYSKIAVVYWGKEEGKWGVRVKFLIDPHSEEEKTKKGEFINGTWCKDFFGKATIKDFVPGKHLYFIQTNLSRDYIEELFKKVFKNDGSIEDDLNWAFINVLYKYQIKEKKPFEVSLSISKDNKVIDRRIGYKWPEDTKLLENIEDNILYRRSMWPFITKLKD